jgi:hypothetical protein
LVVCDIVDHWSPGLEIVGDLVSELLSVEGVTLVGVVCYEGVVEGAKRIMRDCVLRIR